MTLRTGQDNLILKRRLWIALCGGIVLEEALDLSSDSILNNNNAKSETSYFFYLNTYKGKQKYVRHVSYYKVSCCAQGRKFFSLT